MTKIGLISDTHGYLDEAVFNYFDKCHEIWHAGDFGSLKIVQTLIAKSGLPVKGVYGNIDGNDVRSVFPEKIHFTCEEVNVFIQHIGGFPPRYAPGVREEIISHHSKLFISGHSHILKIIYDDKLDCLHMNPGAAGREGWHKVRTVIRFAIDGSNIKDCEAIELGKRG